VDIEVESDAQFRNAILEKARSLGCQVIVSYHNFKKTPKKSNLEHIISQCFESGADVAKIACMVHSEKDNALLLGLLNEERPLVVVGLGEKGKICRIAAPFLGSPFTYASLSKGKETAEGQLDWETLQQIIQALKNV
jgi:3-dehydroquinate dehydratase-1